MFFAYRNESIVHFVISTPEPILYEMMCTKDESHSGEYFAKIILEVIDEVGPERMLAVITDSASLMIINDKYKHINSDASTKKHVLTRDQTLLGNKIIQDLISYLYGEDANEIVEVITDFADFKDQIGQFGKPFLQKSIFKFDARTWWRSIAFQSVLRLLIVDILGMPATTAATG